MATFRSTGCAACLAASDSTSGFAAVIHIFTKTGVEEILNLQPKGRNAKPYQVKQVRAVIVKYRLAGGTNGQ